MSAAERWPHIYISDSLVMADTAVKMAEDGCKWVDVILDRHVGGTFQQEVWWDIPTRSLESAASLNKEQDR